MLAWTKLKICLYYDPHGGAGGRQMIRNYEWYKRSRDSSAPTNDLQFDILVTSYQIFVKDQAYFEKARISWRMLIVDEGHRLRNVKSKLLQTLRDVPADYRVLMTGTPLHNNVLELWSLLNFVSPGIYINWALPLSSISYARRCCATHALWRRSCSAHSSRSLHLPSSATTLQLTYKQMNKRTNVQTKLMNEQTNKQK